MDLRTDDAVERRPHAALRLTRTHALLIALLPWGCLAFDRQWIYSASGMIDPWLYHGYFHRLPEFVSTLYNGTYYGTRLAWILPGYVTYSLFPPQVANLVLHVGLYYIAAAGLYRTVAVLADRNSALFTTIAFGTFWQVLISLGWDYVDGAVIAYSSVSLACFVSAARSSAPFTYLVAAGATSAAMVHSNLGAAMLVPSGAIAYFVLQGRESVRKLGILLVASSLGALALTALLSLVNLWAGGPWLFFWASVKWAATRPGNQSFPSWISVGLPTFAQLIVPAVGALTASALIILRRRPTTIAAAVPILWGWCAFALFDALTGGGLLQIQYYVSWLLMPAFLVIGVAVAPLSAAPGIRRAAVAAIAICLMNWAISPHLSFRGDRRSQTQFALVQQTMRFVSAHVPQDRGRPIFWLEQGPANPFVSSLVSTHLFLYSLAGATYPTLPDDVTKWSRAGATITPGSELIVVSYGPPNQSAIERELARFGLSARIGVTEGIEAGAVRLLLTTVDVGPPPHGQ